VADLIGGKEVDTEEWKEGSGHEIFLQEDDEGWWWNQHWFL